MTEEKKEQQEEQEEQEEEKKPSFGDRAKEAVKDEAVRAARWEGRSFLYRLLGPSLGNFIRRLFG